MNKKIFSLILITAMFAAVLSSCKKDDLPTFAVAFDSKGGTPTPEMQIVKKGGTVEKPADPTLPDHQFAGWTTADNAASPLWDFANGTVTADMTLYAKWEYNPPPPLIGTVSFNGNGHTSGIVPASETVSNGSSITLPGQGSMTKTDYDFSGWNTLTGTHYDEGDSYTVNGDATLYARWTKNVITISNPIENPSVEDAQNATTPRYWHSDLWSVPANAFTSTFTYLNEGHTGNRSVKVEITGYGAGIEGDAKWYFDHVELVPGTDYIFSDWYKSNVDSRIVIECITDENVREYYELPGAPPSANWTKYETSFTMPANGVRITVYHLLSQNGWLITDDYQLDIYNYEGFNQGIVTLTFDDGWEENPETALPIMNGYGFKSTQFYATTFIIDPWTGYNPKTIIQKFIDAGHEIGSHSITHPDLTTLSAQNVTKELLDSKTYLQSFLGVEIKHFATPYGIYNEYVKNEIMKHYDTHVTVDIGYNSRDNLDLSKLKRMSILSTTTAAEVQEWVEKARDEKLWLILLYHRVADNPGDYDTTVELFTQQMKVIYDSGIQVKTISEAIAEIKNQ